MKVAKTERTAFSCDEVAAEAALRNKKRGAARFRDLEYRLELAGLVLCISFAKECRANHGEAAANKAKNLDHDVFKDTGFGHRLRLGDLGVRHHYFLTFLASVFGVEDVLALRWIAIARRYKNAFLALKGIPNLGLTSDIRLFGIFHTVIFEQHIDACRRLIVIGQLDDSVEVAIGAGK